MSRGDVEIPTTRGAVGKRTVLIPEVDLVAAGWFQVEHADKLTAIVAWTEDEEASMAADGGDGTGAGESGYEKAQYDVRVILGLEPPE